MSIRGVRASDIPRSIIIVVPDEECQGRVIALRRTIGVFLFFWV